jgi:hypothetical protein
MGLAAAVVTAGAAITAADTLYKRVEEVLKPYEERAQKIATKVENVMDAGKVSLTSYIKPLCITSRVYIDELVYADPVVTDVLKIIHTQYAGFILTALQMNRFVTKDRDVQSMLKVIATEAMLPHESVEVTFSAADDRFNKKLNRIADARKKVNEMSEPDTREQRDARRERREIKRDIYQKKLNTIRIRREDARDAAKKIADDKHDAIREAAELARATKDSERDAIRAKFDEARAAREAAKEIRDAEKAKREADAADPVTNRQNGLAAVKTLAEHGISSATTTGKVVELDGNNHIPAGKMLEITLTNPDNPLSNTTINLIVQLAPYLIPAQIAVEFLTKDASPSFSQRIMQWRTGEISFWRDVVALSDVHNRRERLRRMDPTGVVSAAIDKQTAGRAGVLHNLNKDKANRSRNIANSVLIFSKETVQHAKADCGIDITDPIVRQEYFATSFVMIMVVVDLLYDRVTFYYNGLDDEATFSFDQIKLKNKGDNGLDLVAVMNALGQGRSPKF